MPVIERMSAYAPLEWGSQPSGALTEASLLYLLPSPAACYLSSVAPTLPDIGRIGMDWGPGSLALLICHQVHSPICWCPQPFHTVHVLPLVQGSHDSKEVS